MPAFSSFIILSFSWEFVGIRVSSLCPGKMIHETTRNNTKRYEIKIALKFEI